MIKDYWSQIKENRDVRQNLSRLRQEVKEKDKRKELSALIKGEEEYLTALLRSEDAKTRKNAALLMGDLGRQEFLEPVYEAYQREAQRFVKSSYLTAVGRFDYSGYLDELKEQLKLLEQTEVTEENRKHLTEEMRELSALVVGMEGVNTHRFTGFDRTYDIVLLTNRNFPELTKSQLSFLDPEARTKLFNAGVRARVTNLNWMDKIRTWQELLFVVKGLGICPMDPLKAAEVIANSGLLTLLEESHEGGEPWYFRVELKSRKALPERSAFVKKLSGYLEKLSGRKLINTVTDYEVELRLIENKEGNCNLLLKLYTLKDERFAYRSESAPVSIRPVNAALAAALAKDYMREGAQVLDPFCGAGTMLIERSKAVRAYTSYGLDIQEEYILKARKNTEAAGMTAHYINRDFFEFRHEYLFDEVFTDMPFQLGRVTDGEVFDLYERFFGRIGGFLKEDAVLILYSRNRGFVKPQAARNGFTVLKEYEISMKEGAYVYILCKKGAEALLEERAERKKANG